MNKSVIALVLVTGMGVAGYLVQQKGLGFLTPKTVSSEKKLATGESKESMPGTPLVIMEGRTIITVESLQEEKEKIFKMNPEWEQYKAFMDLDRTILYAMANHAIMDREIEESGVKSSDEYKNDLESAYKEVERMINTKYFTQRFSPDVSDAEVKQVYEENKDSLPETIISHGGVKASEIDFDTETEANDFAQKVKANNNNLVTAVQQAGMAENKIKDLRLVHKQSMAVDQAVKDALLAMVQFPSVAVIRTSDNKYAVVVASSKEDAKYRPYEQVKNHLKAALKKQKQAEAVEQSIEGLKKKYAVVIDLAPLGTKEGEDDAQTAELGDLSDIQVDENQLPPVES